MNCDPIHNSGPAGCDGGHQWPIATDIAPVVDLAASDSVETAHRVSIGMPVYNAERFLREAVDSLLRQTFTDFELIISDNASTDATAEICREYASHDARIRYERHDENRGAAWNFNRVFELATGEYFKWAASDDICAPEFLLRCAHVLDSDPHVVLCHSRSQKINSQGEVLEGLPDPTDGGVSAEALARGAPRPDASSRRALRRFRDVLLHTGWSVRSYSLIRREALARTTLIRPCYGWEKIVMAELALQGRFHDVPEVLFSQRVHAAASSNLKTDADQAQFFAPKQVRTPCLIRLQLLGGYVRAALTHRLSMADRLQCLVLIGRYLGQVDKWPQLLGRALRRRGVGNAGADLEATPRDADHAATKALAQPHVDSSAEVSLTSGLHAPGN